MTIKQIRAEDGTVPKMNKTILNFGLLGCGMAAEVHAGAIKSLENAYLYGVADADASRAAAFAEKQSVKSYNNFDELLMDSSIDVVCICTPNGFHAQNAIAALDAGKHVVVEKPLALNKSDCDAVKEAVEKSGRTLTVISQLRFSEDVTAVKKVIDEGKLGKIVLASAYLKYWRSPEYYSEGKWKGSKGLDGGILMNQGIHGVDLLLYLAGNANVINAKSKTLFHNIEADDTSVSLLEFENGALGVIEASTCAYPGHERRIEIIGSQGTVVLVENRIEKLFIDGKELTGADILPQGGSASDPAAIDYLGHARQINNFIRSVLYGEKLLIDVYEGAKAPTLIEKIYKF